MRHVRHQRNLFAAPALPHAICFPRLGRTGLSAEFRRRCRYRPVFRYDALLLLLVPSEARLSNDNNPNDN